jgi:class 3 adenylate cyclase/tetratricopeptide (TPR) repeat protein
VECGTPLAARCPACGAAHQPNQKFCAECGTPLSGGAAAKGPPVATAPLPVAGELRLASMLFVDLVGYTSLSESRDAEDVRELLSRYFDTARTIVGRYGGAVEKFIGDAVMAVWGVPQAREDDAERAVRAGLELVGAVAAFGDEVGAPQLRARAGVVTGQVAAMSAPGEGLVVGDRVNTAARVQSVAEPGSVYVDDITRQVTSAAIAYVDAGEHIVKGKEEPLHLWRAQRVVAGVAGARGDSELEAAFVGRDSDLRLIKELFHGGVERGSARLVAVTGSPGVGKSRLRREFENYVDGLASTTLWHSGRCLSYGEGVAYFALAEMVRQRLGIPEEEAPDEAARKLRLGLERWIPDPAEREFLEPRLGALIGVAQPGLDRQELFAGWRLFFERLSDELPVALSFEDLHWADDGLLDFIDHLLEWSAEHPIFILGFARPELTDRRAGWPAGRRGATPLYLEPLSDAAVGQLLDGLVGGLPPDARERIVSQAEGIPLYALETVRALADRGVLAAGDGGLRPVGELGDLDVPATLSSLLAARLDGLDPDERELVKAMAVFGGSFPRSAAAALTEIPDERLDEALASLVHKQVLAVRADPLSPDRGQYAFGQTLLRTVAYEMLPKRERRPRHLAAANHLRTVFPNDGEEIAEVIASHLLDAYRAAAGDPDADELRAEALSALRRAANRTISVGAPDAAERAYLLARDLASSDEERTELSEAAGAMAMRAGRYEAAIELLDAAAAAHSAAGRELDAARLAEPIGVAMQRSGRIEEGIERTKAALAILEQDPLDPGTASVGAVVGMCLTFAGRHEEAAEYLERALITAQALELPVPLCRALNARAVSYMQQTRFDEALGLWAVLADIAERNGLTDLQSSALSNIGNVGLARDLPEAQERISEALALSRRIGDSYGRLVGTGNLMLVQLFAGRWDEMEQLGHELLNAQFESQEDAHVRLACLKAWRGEPAGEHVAALASWRHSDNIENRFITLAAESSVALSEGRYEMLLAEGTATVRGAVEALGPLHESLRILWPNTLEAAMADDRIDVAAELVQILETEPRGRLSPYLRAELHRGRGLVAAAREAHDEVEAELRAAVDDLSGLGYPYPTARAQIDLASWMIGQGRQTEAAKLLAEAVATLTPLRATPALTRAGELLAGMPAAAA